ncbi:MAG: heparinase II/III-family protein, partial [Pirellulaceae bacterium]|nr:heparinase II/III-family protein [Pirellulaceae bacterium]
GYDWLYDQWTADQRQVLHTAIVELGLQPGLKVYQASGGWPKSQHNWNQVCNGGMTLGALALADLEPQLAGAILENAIRSVPLAMKNFAPDGAWGEGPGYWSYATQYNVAMLAALESALGTDYGLSAIPGFSEAGTFPIYLTGPLDRTFNFADAGAGTPRPPQLFWLARKFNRPEYAAFELAHAEPSALDLVYYDPRGHQVDLSKLPLDKVFRDAEVGVFRSAWDDRNALWVAFKAGSNAVNHSNLDLGTFVLEALGERWFVDLGADDYNLPGYFGGQRWDYYRLRAEGHNTLVINPGSGPDQDPKAATKIVRFEAAGDQPSAMLDLTPAYAAHATQVQRTISLIDRHSVTIRDELETKSPADIWSMLHTPAEIDLNANGREATLQSGRQSLVVELVSPADAKLEVLPVAPLPTSPQPDRQAANKGVRKLGVHLTGASKATIEVRLKPVWP